MGKILIIKGVDFSSVAVEHVTPEQHDFIVYYDFINFDGASYVETNVKTKANTKVETAAVATAWTAQNMEAGHVLGTRSAGLAASNDKFICQIGAISSFTWSVSAAIGNMSNYANTGINGALNTKYSFVADASTLVINGTSYPLNSTITPGTYPFIIGNSSEAGLPLALGQALTGRVYETKFYEGETLVADFKPCTKDGVAGFYDTVGGQFYGNSGTGTLTAGNDSM